MRAPRESFKLTGRAGDFQKLRSTEPFELACDYALLQLLSEMPPNTVPLSPTDPYVGLDANAQMFGARRVIEILKTLGEPEPTKTPEKRPSLYHNPQL